MGTQTKKTKAVPTELFVSKIVQNNHQDFKLMYTFQKLTANGAHTTETSKCHA